MPISSTCRSSTILNHRLEQLPKSSAWSTYSIYCTLFCKIPWILMCEIARCPFFFRPMLSWVYIGAWIRNWTVLWIHVSALPVYAPCTHVHVMQAIHISIYRVGQNHTRVHTYAVYTYIRCFEEFFVYTVIYSHIRIQLWPTFCVCTMMYIYNAHICLGLARTVYDISVYGIIPYIYRIYTVYILYNRIQTVYNVYIEI